MQLDKVPSNWFLANRGWWFASVLGRCNLKEYQEEWLEYVGFRKPVKLEGSSKGKRHTDEKKLTTTLLASVGRSSVDSTRLGSEGESNSGGTAPRDTEVADPAGTGTCPLPDAPADNGLRCIAEERELPPNDKSILWTWNDDSSDSGR